MNLFPAAPVTQPSSVSNNKHTSNRAGDKPANRDQPTPPTPPTSPDEFESLLREALAPPSLPDSWTEETLHRIRRIPDERSTETKKPLRLFPVTVMVGVAAIAAAAIMLIGLSLYPESNPSNPSNPSSSPIPAVASTEPADINQDGTINVLDAFSLAAALQRGESNPEWDLNQDGLINDDDTQWVASRAVQLDAVQLDAVEPKRRGTS